MLWLFLGFKTFYEYYDYNKRPINPLTLTSNRFMLGVIVEFSIFSIVHFVMIVMLWLFLEYKTCYDYHKRPNKSSYVDKGRTSALSFNIEWWKDTHAFLDHLYPFVVFISSSICVCLLICPFVHKRLRYYFKSMSYFLVSNIPFI